MSVEDSLWRLEEQISSLSVAMESTRLTISVFLLLAVFTLSNAKGKTKKKPKKTKRFWTCLWAGFKNAHCFNESDCSSAGCFLRGSTFILLDPFPPLCPSKAFTLWSWNFITFINTFHPFLTLRSSFILFHWHFSFSCLPQVTFCKSRHLSVFFIWYISTETSSFSCYTSNAISTYFIFFSLNDISTDSRADTSNNMPARFHLLLFQ